MDAELEQVDVFDGVVLATTSDLEPVTLADDVCHAITARGGTVSDLQHLHDVTHIVSRHVDFPEYERALDLGIHVVKPSWVAQSLTKGRLCNPRQHSPDPSQFLNEVVVCCADLPEGDKDAIEAGCLALGGQYSRPLNKITSHIITMSMDHEKCRVATEKGLFCKIVLPHWFNDCLRLGKRISEDPYEFPDPEILRVHTSDPIRINPSPYVEGATSATPRELSGGWPTYTPPSSPSQSRSELDVFTAKKIMLSSDLKLGEHLYRTLATMISNAGGTTTTHVDDADIYIGQHRLGLDYVTASRAGKLVANLSWLYHVLNTNRWTNPTSKLLFYPLPKDGIPGFQGMKISVSNYIGNARVYLENLIVATGAEFTKTMKMDNTHLITAHKTSEKCDAAQEWNINIVNHLWLEDSYAKCMVQTLTNTRYTYFPPRTNLGEVAGNASLDMTMIEREFFAKGRFASHSDCIPPKDTSKVVSKPAVGVNTDYKSEPESRGRGTSGVDGLTTMDEEQPTPQAPSARKRGRPPKSSLATPREGVDGNKENQSPAPTSTGGRASKAKALNKLHAAAADIEQYQKELKRKGGVTHGRGRRSSYASEAGSETGDSPAPAPSKRGRKRSSDEATYDVTAEGSDLSDGETQRQGRPAKKGKSAATASSLSLPRIKYRMMVTGDERWVTNPNKESIDKNKLRMLGVLLVTDPKHVDILVAPGIRRTRKFVAAIADAPLVVDSKYLDAALKKNVLPEDPPLMDDKSGEENFDFDLARALERAKINNHKLFRGWSIFVTKSISAGFDTVKEIVMLNGGTTLLYQGRLSAKFEPRMGPSEDADIGEEWQNQGGEAELDRLYLVSGVSDAEIKLWKPFREMARRHGLSAKIVRTDWLLNSAMRQEIKWEPKWELDESTL